MVQKLSSFLGTSFTENPVDSAGIVTIIGNTTILLDSGTSGNYVRTLTAGNGFNFPSAAHSLDGTLTVDSSFLPTLTGTQTLTNKTINLSNNTLVTTLSQLSSAVSGDAVAGVAATQTLTNKTLTSPTINTPTIAGPGSITQISTFGLRDTTTTTYDTRIVSNNASPVLTANRTLTLDVNNADRNISLTGNLTLGGDLTTSGAHSTTFTTSGNTSVTLPTSGTLATVAQVNAINPDVVGDTSPQLGGVLDVNGQGIDFGDGEYLRFGDNNEHRISHNGTSSSLRIESTAADKSIEVRGTAGTNSKFSVLDNNGTNVIVATMNGASSGVTLHHGGGTRLSTSSSGITVGGDANFADNDKAIFGTSGDLEIFYSGTSGIIKAAAGQKLKLRTTDEIRLENTVGSTSMLEALAGGAVNLFYDGSKKFETTTSGVSITGTMTVTSDTLVSNLNADKLDGQQGSHYRIDVYNASGTLLN